MSGTTKKTGGGKWTPRTPAELRAAHVAKMHDKAERRERDYRDLSNPKRVSSLRYRGNRLAFGNHKHAREIARHLRQAGAR